MNYCKCDKCKLSFPYNYETSKNIISNDNYIFLVCPNCDQKHLDYINK
jgi:Zn finger protein HypA/HybF involved in hydrogenase expression